MIFRKYFLPYLVLFFYILLSSTWRKKLIISDETQRAIKDGRRILLAHWHGDELAVLHLVNRFKLATMTSTSKDGELIDFIIRKLGGKTSRGSSTRGGVGALLGLVRLVTRGGHMASIAVDGPRGPIHFVKPGIFELSRLTEGLIVPVGVYVKEPFIFQKSWNKAILPLPFQNVIMTFGQPIPPINRNDSTKDIALAENLKNQLFIEQKKASNIVAASH